MKLRHILCLLLAAGALSVVSCKNDKGQTTMLQAPELSIEGQTSTSFAVVWNAVEGADQYSYEFNGQTDKTTETRLEFKDLVTDTVYVVKVKAGSSVTGSESEWAERTVTLSSSMINTDGSFEVSTTSNGTDLTVNIVPKDKEMPYFVDVLPESYYVEDFGSDKDSAFNGILLTAYNTYADDAFDEINLTGDRSRLYDLSRYGEAKYYVLVAGIDESLNTTTSVNVLEVTLDLNISSNTFTVTGDEILETSITVTVVPSNSDSYYFFLTDASDIEGMTQAELRSQAYSKADPEDLSTSTETVQWTGLTPGTDYVVLVYGFDGEAVTTDVSVFEFSTLEAIIDANMTFKFNVQYTGSNSVYFTIEPSNKSAYYFYHIITMAEYEKYKDDLSQYCLAVCEEWDQTPYSYFRRFSSVGDIEDEYALEWNQEFVLFAVPIEFDMDNNVTFYEASIYDGEIRTGDPDEPEDPDTPDTEESMTFSDMTMLYIKGSTVISVTVEPEAQFAGRTYVYDIITEADWNTYKSDISAYFKQKYEASGSTVSYAEYITGMMLMNYQYINTNISLNPGKYYLLTVGVKVSGEEAVFQTPQVFGEDGAGSAPYVIDGPVLDDPEEGQPVTD
ncbi:MAG TPA: hypothetical protein IAC04_02950 [Candidatus Coprenecus stercoravium]|uniref:Fibronectin type-III domain-containing protein n=1 Tax=Candidatus Coprenecus stercoravium TaxID=2840735 RepID=A0A9D2K931_9BACT|nr:hypothetical protein [Candidatus Coprenecus stercoravium]